RWHGHTHDERCHHRRPTGPGGFVPPQCRAQPWPRRDGSPLVWGSCHRGRLPRSAVTVVHTRCVASTPVTVHSPAVGARWLRDASSSVASVITAALPRVATFVDHSVPTTRWAIPGRSAVDMVVSTTAAHSVIAAAIARFGPRHTDTARLIAESRLIGPSQPDTIDHRLPAEPVQDRAAEVTSPRARS